MDLKKLGKYLAYKRKELGYTQKYIADTLNISDKTVSKWERGINAPDISILDKLSKTLNISVYDLLAAEDIKNDDQNLYEVLGGIIIFYNKLTRKKYIKIFLFTTLIIIFLFISLFIINCHNKYKIYTIESNDENYIVDGIITFFPEKKIFVISDISITDNRSATIIEKPLKSISIKLKDNDKILLTNVYSVDNNININDDLVKRTIYSYESRSSYVNIYLLSKKNYEISIEYITNKDLYEEINIPLKLKRVYA